MLRTRCFVTNMATDLEKRLTAAELKNWLRKLLLFWSNSFKRGDDSFA